MQGKYNIPFNYKEGVYGINELKKSGGESLNFSYSETRKILTYDIPGDGYGSGITFYSVPKDELEETLKASYDSNGHLENVTATIKEKDMLLYIYYKNIEEAKKELKDFALENADVIIGKLCVCKEKISRLFVEYFNDGEYLDFHVKTGTSEQEKKVREKYPDSKYAVDNCGNYPLENIYYGDNDKLKVMVLCADNDKMDLFQYVVDIMTGYIREKAAGILDKADNFKFIASVYD